MTTSTMLDGTAAETGDARERVRALQRAIAALQEEARASLPAALGDALAAGDDDQAVAAAQARAAQIRLELERTRVRLARAELEEIDARLAQEAAEQAKRKQTAATLNAERQQAEKALRAAQARRDDAERRAYTAVNGAMNGDAALQRLRAERAAAARRLDEQITIAAAAA
jgi:chromosome segregation ATPase